MLTLAVDWVWSSQLKPSADSHIWVHAEDKPGQAGSGRLHVAVWLGPNSHCILDGVWRMEGSMNRVFSDNCHRCLMI
jgi:hypothetical protein